MGRWCYVKNSYEIIGNCHITHYRTSNEICNEVTRYDDFLSLVCPTGWTHLSSKTTSSCFKYINNELSYDNARISCDSLYKSHLAMTKDEDINKKVAALRPEDIMVCILQE